MVGRPVLTSPPGCEPISLSLVKQALRIDAGDTSRDSYLLLLISVARETAEQITIRGYVTQSYREYYDGFPGHHFPLALIDGLDGDPSALAAAWPGNEGRRLRRHYFELSRSPLQVLKQIQYLDLTGTLQTLDPGQYVLNDKQDPAQITRAPEILGGLPWPRALHEVNSVWIDYTVGYGGNLTLSMTATSAALTGYTFLPSDVGRPISIPGAGASGATLITTVLSVDDSGNGIAAAAASTTVADVQTYLGKPIPFGDTQAMLYLINHWNENGLPVVNGLMNEIPYGIDDLLKKNRVYYQP